MLCLLIGNVLLIGILSGTPIYVQAAMQRILIGDFEQIQRDRNIHPTTIQVGFRFSRAFPEESLFIYETLQNEGVPLVINTMGIPVEKTVQNLVMNRMRVQPKDPREVHPRARELNFNTFDGFEDHITLLHGRLPSDELGDGNIIEGVANHQTMYRNDLLLGELLVIANVTDDESESTTIYYLKIVGVYEATGEQGVFWGTNPNNFQRTVLVSHTLVENYFLDRESPGYGLQSYWTILLDFYGLSTFDVNRYFEANRRIYEELVEIAGDRLFYQENFIEPLINYVGRTNRLIQTLLVLQVPIYIFLAFYIYIISRQVLRLEQNDISILKSRGISRWQIIYVYFMQSVLIGILSIILGIPLGIMVCRLLGASNGFLELVSRAAIDTPINRHVFFYSGIGALASMVMMLLPVIGFSKVSIIEHKRSKSRWQKKPFWQRYFLDVLFLLISIYGHFNFISRREIMALTIVDVQTVDPLLYLSSTLFIIGLGLLFLRVYPYLVKLIFMMGNKLWSPALYTSLLKVIRFSSGEQYIMIFLVFTLSLGIFSATTARTLNTNHEDMIQHQIGADLVFAERFMDNVPCPRAWDSPEPDRIIYTEPDFQRFTNLPYVDALTRVMVSEVTVRKGINDIENVTLMGIETDTFGETIWYREDLLPIHINFFLNTLASYDNGFLLSKNFKTRYDFQVGERIRYRDDYGNDMWGEVVGFVEHWPAFTDRVMVQDSGGMYLFQDDFLIVANLGHIHSTLGIYPYQVWMNTNEPTNHFFYELAEELNLRLIHFEDAKAAVIEGRRDPILQGTNGILTAGFIFTFLACFVGYLIYWILSLKSNVLQFGVFRAMGMTRAELIRLLFYEQVLISFSAVGIGFVVGEISSRLFVPLIQMAYSPSLQTIPLMIVIENRDYLNIFSIVGFMFILCLIILGVLVSKVKIASALKLGED